MVPSGATDGGPTLPPQERWTTFELLDFERRVLDTATSLLGAERAVCPSDELLAALRSTPSRLSDEQATAVIAMTQSGNGVDVLTAPAGAGKTFAFAAARDAWERAGYRVVGAAHTGLAADELSMAAAIPSTTLARLLIAIDRGEPGGLDARTVLVIDEAGTAGTRDLARILDHVQHTGAKAVLVGDPKQLPEIAAGGLFAALTERLPVLELSDNRRQQHEWEIEALRQLRDGNTTHALHAYLDHGRITVGHDARHTKRCSSLTVIDIETYRQSHDITDRRTTLGPQPPASDTLGRLDWRQPTWALDDARERLLPPTPSATRAAPEPRFPSLDIGLRRSPWPRASACETVIESCSKTASMDVPKRESPGIRSLGQPQLPTCVTTATWRYAVASRSSLCPSVPLLQLCSMTTSTSC